MFNNENAYQPKANSFSPGIHSGCTIKEAEVLTASSGNKYVKMTVRQESTNSEKPLIIFFPPKKDEVKTYGEETKEQAYERELRKSVGVLTNLMMAQMGPEEYKTSGKDEDEFFTKAIAKIVKHKNKPFHIKLVVDNNNPAYSMFPKYPGAFEMHTEGLETTLKFSKRELEALKEANSTPEESTKETLDDDFPF